MEKNRCVVIGGAPIENYEAVKSYLKPLDYCIFCDCALSHREALGAEPDLVVGDFDSWNGPLPDCEIIRLPRRKDDTDTVFAVKEGLNRGFENFLLLGMLGRRFDHSLGNLSILLSLDAQGKKALLVDDYSEMEIVSGEPAYIIDRYPYFSLLNISGTARKICIQNAAYCLKDGEITCEYQYGISNEVLPGQTACVTVGEGRLLLIKDRV